jgi:hypothetical protein
MLVPDYVIYNFKMKLCLRLRGFGVVNLVSVLRLARFLQWQVAARRQHFDFLPGVRMCGRKPYSYILAARYILYREPVTKRKMPCRLRERRPSQNDETEKQQERSSQPHRTLLKKVG